MTVSTTTDLNGLYNNIYEDAFFIAREMNLMAGLVHGYNMRGYAPRKISRFSQGTVQTVAEGVDYANAVKFEKTLVNTLTPSKAMSQFILTDEMIETDDIDNIQSAAANELGMGIAAKVDVDLLGNFSNFSAGKGAAGSAMTLGYVAAAISKLVANHAEGAINVVIHPFQWHRIWTGLGNPIANQTFQGEIANEALRQYFVGRFLNADWFSTGNISVNASDDAYGAAFTRDALGLDIRKPFYVENERDASRAATEMNGVMGYAHGEVRDEFGCYILSDASEPTS